MICQRCARSLRTNEGIKCSQCESKFHVKCVSNLNKGILRECGDRGYQWKCALCQSDPTTTHSERPYCKENILIAINALTEKFELVNKIQLPKLNAELANIKSVTDRIANQNEEMLRRMTEFESSREKKENNSLEKKRANVTSRSYRKISLNLSPRSKNCTESSNHIPMMISTAEKTARYRTRRRSYLLTRMFYLLNRKFNRTKTSPKRRHSYRI